MTRYTLHIVGEDPIQVDFNSESANVTTRGDTATYDFWVSDDPARNDITISGDVTLSNSQVRGTVSVLDTGSLTIDEGVVLTASDMDIDGTVDNNGTIKIDGLANRSLFDLLQDLGDYAGKYTITETLNSKQKYRDFVPPTASIASILVGIEPHQDLVESDVDGIWGLVDSVSDPRNLALNTTHYQFTIRILGEYSEYSDITDVKNSLEV